MDKVIFRTAILRSAFVATIIGWCVAFYYLGAERAVMYLAVYFVVWVIALFGILMLNRFGIGLDK